jgi:predicted esterase
MKLIRIALQAFLMPSLALFGSIGARTHHTSFISNKKKIHLEERCRVSPAAKPAAIIFLHGSGGPDSANLPYRDEEQDLVKQGYCVYIPHYLDATGGRAENPRDHYSTWIQVVDDTAKYITGRMGITRNRIALVGYSLGASVALAAGATDQRFAALAEFSGSLPDAYLPILQSLPPLLIIHGRDDSVISVENAFQLAKLCNLKHLVCSEQLYSGEGHTFTIAAIMRAKQEVEQFLQDHLQPMPEH